MNVGVFFRGVFYQLFALRRVALTFYLDVKSKQKNQVAISQHNKCESVVGLKLAFAMQMLNQQTDEESSAFILRD